MRSLFYAAALAALGIAVGCHSDKPHKYGKQRPPIDQLDDRDRGLQSKEVVDASDQMAQSLLAEPVIQQSPTRVLIVVDRVENRTTTQRFDMDIFLRRLKVNLSKYGRGKIQLIENRDKLRELQSRELEGAGNDEFQQNGGRAAPGPAGIQPDFSLYARISELPNRGTSYFQLEFNLTGLKGPQARQLVWSDMYEVKTAR